MGTTVDPDMTVMRNFFSALAVTLAVSLLALPAFTQAAEDPPGRVARLSHIEGEVSMAPAGTQEWGEAVLNRPLTSEDRVFVDRDARAELQIGSATVHLDSSTEFSFIDLDDDAMTMRLTEGRATIRILRKREREHIEVNTPNASVALLHPGEYHVEVDQDGDTTVVKARTGEAEVVGESDTFTVRSNEVGIFRGAAELTGDITTLGPRTAFEDWANERARRTERSASTQYVGEGVIGYEDLDEHGRWVHEPEYGRHVWYPTHVAAGWAPYRHGRWAWVSPWGWTWIDDARWGFAPFHYGRWAYVRHRWCWVPGPRHVRAVYAPALVAWVGGPHVSVNVSLGRGVGWFPLGPREVYVPGYWHTHRYIRRVNVSNTIIVNNTYIDNAYRGRYRDFRYRYRDRPHAVTVVEREHFVRGRPIGGHVARVAERDLRRWGHDARPPAIAPVRESVLAGQQPRRARGASSDRDARQVVARRELPTRVSFDAERRAIEANGGRPVARTALLNRNPKDRGDVRVVRGGRTGERRGNLSGGSARTPELSESRRTTRDAIESARATRSDNGTHSSEARGRDATGQTIQRLRATEDTRRERAASDGSAPSTDSRRERNSSDRSERAQRNTQPRVVTPSVRESSREAVREASPRRERSAQGSISSSDPRSERSSTPERRSQPRIERSNVRPQSQPQAERSYSQPQRQLQPRVERSYSQPQRQSQPRVERSYSQPQRQAQPRVERSRSSSSSGRSSSHSRGSVSRER